MASTEKFGPEPRAELKAVSTVPVASLLMRARLALAVPPTEAKVPPIRIFPCLLYTSPSPRD